jgi:hypothetical protein
MFKVSFPRSSRPAGSADFVEAVFRPEIFRIFSNAFRPVPVAGIIDLGYFQIKHLVFFAFI